MRGRNRSLSRIGLVFLGIAGALVAQQPPQFTGIQPLTNREIRLQLSAQTGLDYRIEISTNLLHWDALLTLLGSGLNQHTDSAAPYLSSRIYRAFQLSGTNFVTGDHLATDDGDVIVHPINHATLVMSWNGKMIYNDPVGAATIFQGLPRADLILVSHSHSDHFSIPRLEKSPRHLEWVKVKHGNREVNWSARAGAPPVELSIADLLWHLLSVCWLAAVAQIFNLLYRRIVFGRASHGPTREYCSRPQSTTPRYSGDTAEGGETATRFGFATTAPRESKASRYACHRTPKNLRGLRRFPEILIEYNPELRRGRLTHT